MKLQMKNNLYKKIYSLQKVSAGFTLIELLVAMTLTSIVVAVAGSGLVTIMGRNSKTEAETERRVNLNRALDFIADDIRTASKVDNTIPGWAWTDLGGGSPSAKLYVQIPLKSVQSMTASDDFINVPNHGFSNGNAVMFTGTGTIAGGLSTNTTYYVVSADTNKFQVSSTVDGSAINLTSNSSADLTANQLLIYYNRASNSTWLLPNTINRSAGPCSGSFAESNCPALVDSIAASGFTAIVTSSRQAEIHLLGKLFNNSTETYEVSTKAFARANL